LELDSDVTREVQNRLTIALGERYSIERDLGSGGMATVYLAHDLRHDREVALKVLRPELAAVVGTERFLAEIKITAGLTHPNILPLLDSGAADGLLYYVTPYIGGQSLDERLAREPQLPIAEALDIARQVAAALDYAHRRNVIHRDVKPANILLHEGAALITDFGIALAVSFAGGKRLTETGYSPGTPEYMSPEQGSGDAVDQRSDIYSLACVLYEMLTGEPPFSGRTAQSVIAKRFSDPVPSARRIREAVPEAVDAAVMRGMAKNPADRFATASEFAEALSAEYLRTASSNLIPKRRSLLIRLNAVAAVVVLMIGAVWFLWLRQPPFETSRHERLSLAVLPLENLSGDTEKQFVVEGIHEALVSELGRVLGSEVDVKGRRSVLRYRDSELSLPQIARELGGVDLLVEGDVEAVGDRVRVSARLIHADPERTLWTDSYDFSARDILSLYGSVAQAIAGEIEIEITPLERERIAGAGTVDQQAYESYLHGRQYMNRMTDLELDLERAIDFFGEALERDSTYAKAYAGIARAYYMLAWSHVLAPEFVWPGMLLAVRQALLVDDGSAEVRLSLALLEAFHDWDWEAADREFRAALRINPSKVDAHSDYALFLSIVGRHSEAVEHAQMALRLEPDDVFEQWQLGSSFLWSGRYSEAMQLTRELVDDHPEFALGYQLLSNLYGAEGRFTEAIAAMRNSMRLAEENEVADEHAQLGYYFARLGLPDSAAAQLASLDQLAARGQYVSPLARSLVFIGLGDYDTAFELMEEGYRTHDSWMPYVSAWKTSFLAPIQTDPRLEDLLQRLSF